MPVTGIKEKKNEIMNSDNYRGAQLHLHFSGIVSSNVLLDELYEKWQGQIFYNTRKCTLEFSRGKGNFNRKLYLMAKTQIDNSRGSDGFRIIGNLFYHIIKDIRFYRRYLQLIGEQMGKDRTDHIEVRLRLGSLNDQHGRRIPIEDEMRILRDEIDGMGTSIGIIAQHSKHSTPRDIQGYFADILGILNRHADLRSLIVAFDITGDETSGHPLSDYREIVVTLRRMMLDIGIIVPFIFHAGEVDSEKGLRNMEFALQCGGRRIGHGIYHEGMDMELIKGHYVMEFCPISNNILYGLSKETLSRIRESSVMYCINADDPNKLGDAQIGDNVRFLIDSGFSDRDIALAYRVSIWSSLCSADVRMTMYGKWMDAYAHMWQGEGDVIIPSGPLDTWLLAQVQGKRVSSPYGELTIVPAMDMEEAIEFSTQELKMDDVGELPVYTMFPENWDLHIVKGDMVEIFTPTMPRKCGIVVLFDRNNGYSAVLSDGYSPI